MRLEGSVTGGLGRGAHFLNLEWVRQELLWQLDLIPFPGTLNLRVSPETRDQLYARRHTFRRIADPSAPECPGYLCGVVLRANGRACDSCYVILPEQTVYRDVVEIISAQNLRETLKLADGDRVSIEETVSGR